MASVIAMVTWLVTSTLMIMTSNVDVASRDSASEEMRAQREAEVSDEQRLFRKLMRKYEKSVRPVINATTPVVVKLGITLTQIFDMVGFHETNSF